MKNTAGRKEAFESVTHHKKPQPTNFWKSGDLKKQTLLVSNSLHILHGI